MTKWLGMVRPMLRGAAWFGVTGVMPWIAQGHMALSPETRRAEVWDFYYRRWARSAIPIFGVDLRVVPTVIPKATGPRLVVANHRSPMDIPLLISLFGGQVLSRADLEHWPVLGHAAKVAGTIFVNRESKTSGAAAVRAIRGRLAAGKTVIMFPEGGTFGGDEVRPFQPGAFLAAQGTGAEIVPVGLAYPPGSEWTDEGFGEHLLRVAQTPSLPVSARVGQSMSQTGDAKRDAGAARDAVQRLTLAARETTPGKS